MNLYTLETFEQIDTFCLALSQLLLALPALNHWLQKTLVKWHYQTCSRQERGL